MTPAFRAVVRKEIRQVTRDRRMIQMLVVAPFLQTIVFGYAVNFEIEEVSLAVCDLDGTEASRSIVRAIEADGTFREAGPVADCAVPEREVVAGRAQVALLIPEGLERDIAGERTAMVQVLVDGTNPTVGRFSAVAAEAAVDAWAMGPALERLDRARGRLGARVEVPAYEPRPRLLYNPQMKSPVFMVPGVSAMLLLIVTTIVTAMGLSRERELGTLEQVLVTPIHPRELILGKLAPFIAVGVLDVILALVVATLVFDVPVRGSLVVLAVGTLLYLLSTLGLGVFISTVSRTQQQAFMGGFFTIMPAILLSGVMTPVENMPVWLRPIAWVNPVKYFVDVLRGVMLKAADFSDLAVPLGALAAFGTVILGFSLLRFRTRLG